MIDGELTTADLVDGDGSLLARPTYVLSAGEAATLRAAAKLLRRARYRLLVRCDACFEASRPSGMRGLISASEINLECRCRWLKDEAAAK